MNRRPSFAVALFTTLGLPLLAAGEECPPRGLVIVVGGIGGLDPIQTWAPPAFEKAGVPHEIRLFEWTHGKGRLLRDLQDYRHLIAKAEVLACKIRCVQVTEPGRPIYLVGHSAGAGLILEATAHLPPASVERIVLLSAAVSPGFDLRPALRATRGEVLSYSSLGDYLWLGWGTTQFGTVDRVYGPSAGMCGFCIPPGLDAEGRQLYRRLIQVHWEPGLVRKWWGGMHHSTGSPLFLATCVAPWLGVCRPCLEGEGPVR